MSARIAITALLLVSALPRGYERVSASLGYRILHTYDHDPEAYTQGLVYYEGYLYESNGIFGASTLRKVEVETGRVVAEVPVDPLYFAEGLALVGSELVQLTWKEGVALVYDVETLQLKTRYDYDGDGWGLCFDGASLFMTDGSSTIFERDPETFEILSEITVLDEGSALPAVNELECVGEFIFANVYQTNRIVKIDKRSGEVVDELDGSRLSDLARRPEGSDAVLNGIAYVEDTDVFLVTGKLWGDLFAIKLTND